MLWDSNQLATVLATSAGDGKGVPLFATILFVIGASHCLNISSRPTTNTKCALSLMCVLLAFAAVGVGGTVASIGPAAAGTPMLMVGMGLFVMMSIAAAIVLGIIGLIEYAGAHGQYTQGRAQAIWALALSTVIGLLLIGGFIAGLAHAQSLRAGNGRPAVAVTNAALNYRFRPPQAWMQWAVTNVNKDAQFGFIRQRPEVYLIGVAEICGNESILNNKSLADLGFTRMQSVSRSARELSRTPYAINGLQGLLVECNAETMNNSLYYVRWCCVTNGWAYQILGWGRQSDRRQIDAEVRLALNGFDVLDPTRQAPRPNAFTTDFVSPRHRYKAAVGKTAWGKFSSLDRDFPYAEFGATRGTGQVLAVVPIWLGEQELSEEALASALLSTMNITYPDQNLVRTREITDGHLQGVEYGYERELAGTEWVYRLRCLQGGGFGYLVAAWTAKDNANADAFLSDAFAPVSFQSPARPLTPVSVYFTLRELKTRGHVMNEAGLFYYKMHNYEKACALFREAASSFADEPTYVLNAIQAWSRLDQPKDALEYLNANSNVVRKVPELRAYQANFQAELGFMDQSFTNYAKLFASGYRSDSHLADYVSWLNSEGRYDVAHQEVERYLKVKDSMTVRLLEADIYRAQKEYPQAITLLQAQHEKAPHNIQVANTLTEVLLDAKRYSEALTLSKESLRTSTDGAYPQLLKGRAELGLKWYREAKASFEAALQLSPSSENAREYLNLVSGILGEGSNTSLKQSLPTVPLPASLTNATLQKVSADYATDYGAYYSRRITAMHFEPGKSCRTTDYLFLHVLDSSGVAAFSTVQMDFDPVAEDIFVNELSVFDATGKLVSEGKVSDYYVLDEHNETSTTRRKTLNIPVAGLRPGCTVRLVITRSELGRAEEFPQFQFALTHAIPAQESIVFISGNTSGLKFGTSTGVEELTLPEGRAWRDKNPLVARIEPMQPAMASYLPMLWVADRNASWTGIATNYLGTIHDRIQPDAAIKAQGLALVAGLTNEQSRLEAVVRHVQTNYIYKAIEFGRRARVPNPPAEISHNKYGDCKDHSVLLVQLLEAAGIPARLALAVHGGDVQKDYPTLDQFNHMIVYVPGVHGGQFVDCTDKGSDLTQSVPYGLAKSDVLVLDGAQSHFVTVPDYPPTGCGIEVRRTIKFASPTEASVEESILLQGAYASFMRNYLLQISATSRRAMLQRQFAGDNKDLGEFKTTGLENPGADLKISVSYPLRKPLRPESDSFIGSIREGMERPYLETTPVFNRLSPFEIQLPFSVRVVVEIAPPPGYAAQLLPVTPAKLDPRFGGYASQSKTAQNTLILEVTGQQHPGKFAAGDYATYHDTMTQAAAMLEREIILKPGKL